MFSFAPRGNFLEQRPLKAGPVIAETFIHIAHNAEARYYRDNLPLSLSLSVSLSFFDDYIRKQRPPLKRTGRGNIDVRFSRATTG